jgi:hypothetical protein
MCPSSPTNSSGSRTSSTTGGVAAASIAATSATATPGIAAMSATVTSPISSASNPDWLTCSACCTFSGNGSPSAPIMATYSARPLPANRRLPARSAPIVERV